VAPDSKVSVRIIRKESAVDLAVTASHLPTSVPAELPLASEPAADANAAVPAGETTELKLPEFPHTCHVYVPGSHAAGQSLGVLLWLQSLGDAKPVDVIRQWQAQCDAGGLVLVVPDPHKADHWERTDLEYLHRLVERVVSQYKTDSRRVVVGGQGNTGAIAWPLALASRNTIRGVAVAAAPLPRQIRVPQNDAAQRLAIFAAIPPKREAAAAMALALKKVSDAGYNVTAVTMVAPTGQLSDAERNELGRWIDTLDRF
jgi:poly(3-hydroxybutyrate) depolymerase